MCSMDLGSRSFYEKICGYSICIAFFSILISTSIVNISILLVVFFGLSLIVKDKQFINIFIRNKINLSLVILLFSLFLSSFYTIATYDETISILKKYVKLLYIPVCYYVLQVKWIKNKSINYFITGCSIILLLSYLKNFNIIDPTTFSEITRFLGFNYENKLLGGVTIFQHSIIHGVVMSFYFYITFIKARKEQNSYYYLLSFLGFYNIFFMNISRTGYIITSLLIMVIFINFYKNNKYKKNLIFLLVLSLSIIMGNKNTIIERFDNSVKDLTSITNNYYKTSFGLRYIYAHNGIESMILKPIFGHGVGSYKKTIKNYFDENNMDMENYISQNPHNEFISILTQIGLFGLFVFLSFVYFLIKDLYHCENGKAVIIIVIISCLFNSLFYDNVMGIFAVLIISFAMQREKIS